MISILKSRHGMLCGALTALSLLMTLALYRRLPPTVPMHWNIYGEIDAWGARWTLLLSGPGLMAALTLLLAALPGLSPPRYRIDSFRSTWLYLMLVAVALAGYIHLVLLWAALSEHGGSGSDPVVIGRVLLGGCAVPLALIGNVMGKLRRNPWVGIRTPWTLADERVWYATHRLAGKSMVLTSLGCLACVLAGAPTPFCVALLAGGALVPAAWSPVVAWRLARQRK